MSLGTYSDLQTAVANWLDRSDLTARIPEFIALCEADLNTELDVRTIESDQTLSLTAGNRTVALPTGFREALNLWPEYSYGRGEPLRRVMPELLIDSDTSGEPHIWCVSGSTITFDCPADQTYTYTLRMRGGLALSDSSATNLVLSNYPNVYLYGALKHAANYLRDPEGLAIWNGLYNDALTAAKQKEGRDKGRVTLSTEPGALTFYGHRDGFNINRGY